MAFSKLYDSAQAAVADIPDGATVLLGGVSGVNAPAGLVSALADLDVRDLTCVCDSAYYGAEALHRLVAAGCVSRIISPAPFGPGGEDIAHDRWRSGDLSVEVIPWGTLAERMRSARVPHGTTSTVKPPERHRSWTMSSPPGPKGAGEIILDTQPAATRRCRTSAP